MRAVGVGTGEVSVGCGGVVGWGGDADEGERMP